MLRYSPGCWSNAFLSSRGGGRTRPAFVVRANSAPLQPLERGDRFEDPLDEVLSAAGIGEVSGGGSQLDEDGDIVYCGIDVHLNGPIRGLELLRSTLKRLRPPEGTVIERLLPVWTELPL